MVLTLVLVAAVVLTILTIVVSRMGATVHQEELNSHGEPPEPKMDRPADASAEAMGVEAPGEMGLHPEHEQP